MPAVNPGEVWMTDFGMTAKVRPALVLTGNPAADELDLVGLPTPGLAGAAQNPRSPVVAPRYRVWR
jgi:mRNA-degrading endonuclease toxin of MazEF toxin-antitoxin module